MKTVHYKTSHFIRHTGNMIDLDELRRRRALAQQDSLARQFEADFPSPEFGEASGFRPVVLTVTPEERRRARRERRAWRLDVCASLAVVLMTLVFVLQMLL